MWCWRTGRRNGDFLLACRSFWAFEHSGLNFVQRLGFYVHSTERPYFYRTPDELCFPWSSPYLFFHTVHPKPTVYQFFLLLLQFGRDPYKRPGGADPYASPRAMCFRLTGKTREALQVTGGIKARYFCRSRSVPFQGPRGQTHTHKPRRGERGRRALALLLPHSCAHCWLL